MLVSDCRGTEVLVASEADRVQPINDTLLFEDVINANLTNDHITRYFERKYYT